MKPNPILQYRIFVNSDEFKEWQESDPRIIVFNTQFIRGDEFNDHRFGVVYTIEDQPSSVDLNLN